MTVEELEELRQRLSLQAIDGDPKAAKRLDEVEKELDELEVQRRRAVLAQKETEARLERERTDRREAELLGLRTALSDLNASQRADVIALQRSMKKVVELSRKVAERGDELSNVAMQLDHKPHAFDSRRVLPTWLSHQLSEVFPYDLPRGDARMARPLIELVPLLNEEESNEAGSS